MNDRDRRPAAAGPFGLDDDQVDRLLDDYLVTTSVLDEVVERTDLPPDVATRLTGLRDRLVAGQDGGLPLAVDIVRDLAAEDDRPPLDDDGDCHFCEAHYFGIVESHAPSCPWRRAVEWVRAQEGT